MLFVDLLRFWLFRIKRCKTKINTFIQQSGILCIIIGEITPLGCGHIDQTYLQTKLQTT